MNFCLLTNAKPQEHQVVLFWVNQTISELSKMQVEMLTGPRGVLEYWWNCSY